MLVINSLLHSRLSLSKFSSRIIAKSFSQDSNERQNAIKTGPGLEDFVGGEVAAEDNWSNYGGALVKEKGVKRYFKNLILLAILQYIFQVVLFLI